MVDPELLALLEPMIDRMAKRVTDSATKDSRKSDEREDRRSDNSEGRFYVVFAVVVVLATIFYLGTRADHLEIIGLRTDLNRVLDALKIPRSDPSPLQGDPREQKSITVIP